MSQEMYQMISDEKELKWFFDHVIVTPKINEAYSAVWVCRHKKLTPEEQKTLGLTRRETEFLVSQTIRAPRISEGGDLNEIEEKWTFEKFKRMINRFNVSKEAYTTSTGEPLPNKTLVVMMYVNPFDTLKVADELIKELTSAKTDIAAAVLNGKNIVDLAPKYQTFANIENLLKRNRVACKGSRYWMDFDIDVPDWFYGKYINQLKEALNKRFGLKNYIIISTAGGYHILVRTSSVKSNPHDFCKECDTIYRQGLLDGYSEYEKYECVINNSSIPGIPLPGTFQYTRPVYVENKDDFE